MKGKTTNNNKINHIDKLATIGWREWVSLPDFGIETIKAKIDTGAKTSALHAFSIEAFHENGVERVRFSIHPKQRDKQQVVTCEADIFDKRIVSDSGGHREERFVIKTPVCIADYRYKIELTLTSRDSMLFRMLLGRGALKNKFVVNPAKSFLTTRISQT